MNNAALALGLAGLAFMMTVIWGGPLLRILRHFKVGKIIRVEEPGTHMVKMGTPTMGGVMIILPVALITVMLNAVSLIGMKVFGASVLVPLAAMVGYGALGTLDDWEGIRGKRKGEGMRIRTKLIAQIVLALGLAAVLRYLLDVPDLYIPGINIEIELGWLYIPIAGFVIVAMSNAVNFTDGLDGLAGLISATIFAAYGGVALMQGQVFIARFCFTMVNNGRYWSTFPGCHHCSYCLDDWSVGNITCHCRHSCRRGIERCHPNHLFQGNTRATVL
jgi:phospho-N-acetylmuramoyl-pentapeptide-transferase